MTTPIDEGRLSPIPRCPRCGKIAVNVASAEAFLGVLTCGVSRGQGKGFRDGCGAHWWASRLTAGNIRIQLLADYEGNGEFVDALMAHFSLPAWIDRPMYWQIELTGRQLYRYTQGASPAPRGRSAQLLRGVITLLQSPIP